MKTFLKKKEENIDKERREELRKSQPVIDEKNEAVFVNGAKYRRAKDILDLINGNRAAIKQEELMRIEHYQRQLEIQEVDLKSDIALPALYEILGGLIRTISEHTEAVKKSKEMKDKGKKNIMGLKE